MKKNSFFGLLLIAVTILFTGASLISCGGDDDNKSNPDGGGSVDGVSLFGVWRMTSFDGDTDLQYEQKRRYTFNSDYTFLLEDQKSDNVNWRKRNAGTYVTGNRKLTLTITGYYSGSDFVPYSSPEVVTVDITSISDNSLNIKASYTEHGQTYEVTMTFVRESYTGNSGGGNSGNNNDVITYDCVWCKGDGKCHNCWNTGICPSCDGSGWYNNTVGVGCVCGGWGSHPGNGVCNECNGEKKCVHCDGKGYMEI